MVKETTYLLEVSPLARSPDCFPQPGNHSFRVLASSQKQQMHIQAKGHYKTEATQRKAGVVSHLENYGLQCSVRKWSDTSLCPAERKTLYGRFPFGVPFCSASSRFILPPSSLLLWSTVTSHPDRRKGFKVEAVLQNLQNQKQETSWSWLY